MLNTLSHLTHFTVHPQSAVFLGEADQPAPYALLRELARRLYTETPDWPERWAVVSLASSANTHWQGVWQQVARPAVAPPQAPAPNLPIASLEGWWQAFWASSGAWWAEHPHVFASSPVAKLWQPSHQWLGAVAIQQASLVWAKYPTVPLPLEVPSQLAASLVQLALPTWVASPWYCPPCPAPLQAWSQAKGLPVDEATTCYPAAYAWWVECMATAGVWPRAWVNSLWGQVTLSAQERTSLLPRLQQQWAGMAVLQPAILTPHHEAHLAQLCHWAATCELPLLLTQPPQSSAPSPLTPWLASLPLVESTVPPTPSWLARLWHTPDPDLARQYLQLIPLAPEATLQAVVATTYQAVWAWQAQQSDASVTASVAVVLPTPALQRQWQQATLQLLANTAPQAYADVWGVVQAQVKLLQATQQWLKQDASLNTLAPTAWPAYWEAWLASNASLYPQLWPASPALHQCRSALWSDGLPALLATASSAQAQGLLHERCQQLLAQWQRPAHWLRVWGDVAPPQANLPALPPLVLPAQLLQYPVAFVAVPQPSLWPSQAPLLAEEALPWAQPTEASDDPAPWACWWTALQPTSHTLCMIETPTPSPLGGMTLAPTLSQRERVLVASPSSPLALWQTFWQQYPDAVVSSSSGVGGECDTSHPLPSGEGRVRDSQKTGRGDDAPLVEAGVLWPLGQANPHLSPTALEAYLRCPRQFYYKHVLRLPDDTDPLTGEPPDTSALLKGNLLHSVMELFIRHARPLPQAWQGQHLLALGQALFKTDTPPTVEAPPWLADALAVWPSLSAAKDLATCPAVQQTDLCDTLLHTLEALAESPFFETAPLKVLAETKLEGVQLPHFTGDYPWRMTLDAVLDYGEAGCDIIDFKTYGGSSFALKTPGGNQATLAAVLDPWSSADEAHLPHTQRFPPKALGKKQRLVQVPLYALAWQHQHPQAKLRRVGLQLLRPAWVAQGCEAVMLEADMVLERLPSWAQELEEAVIRPLWQAETLTGVADAQVCDKCAYASLCPDRIPASDNGEGDE